MGNLFSSSEIVEMGIQIERNGKDFYVEVAKKAKSQNAKSIFEFLAGEEEKHIRRFEAILSKVKKYEPSEAYPEEYFSYIKALSGEHVFTKKNKGIGIAKSLTTDLEAIELAMGFEKSSIEFYEAMKKVVLVGEHAILDKLIQEEKIHLEKLLELKKII